MVDKFMTYKQAIVVRTDLDLGKGKLAAQVAHAAVGAMKNSGRSALKKWEREGSKKVVLKVSSLIKLKSIHNKSKAAKIPTFLVRDAGLTQLRPGTVTCLGIGPAQENKIDLITSDLKLL
jgi:PTH2 family peptidyl-tRNA hydrolase